LADLRRKRKAASDKIRFPFHFLLGIRYSREAKEKDIEEDVLLFHQLQLQDQYKLPKHRRSA
jgi:hypothetical protein